MWHALPLQEESQFFNGCGVRVVVLPSRDPGNLVVMFRMQAFDAIIGLGSNLGDKRANIARAIEVLTAPGDVHVVARSRDYRTAPWGVTEQDWFVNACIAVKTELPARDLLERCFAAERALQRVRRLRWGPRSIDCDVLFYRDVQSNDPALTLPHPRITERAFVLVPLAEIAPQLVIEGRRAAQWLTTLDASDVVAME